MEHHDSQLVKRWKDELNGLLVFVRPSILTSYYFSQTARVGWSILRRSSWILS